MFLMKEILEYVLEFLIIICKFEIVFVNNMFSLYLEEYIFIDCYFYGCK